MCHGLYPISKSLTIDYNIRLFIFTIRTITEILLIDCFLKDVPYRQTPLPVVVIRFRTVVDILNPS